MKKSILLFAFVFLIIIALYQAMNQPENDEWHNFDGSEIICRISGCGKHPLYSDWDNRFCEEHIDHSLDHAYEYDPSIAKKKINTERALTREEADALSGTGYHGCRPNSSAENLEIRAAMNKCVNCGMRTHNGANSLCYECRYNKEHGFD